MKLIRFDQVAITASNIVESVHFYVDILGMELDRTNDRYSLVFGNQRINIRRIGDEDIPAPRNETLGSAGICLVAEGKIASIYEELRGKNAPFAGDLGIVSRTVGETQVDSVYLQDPDGNLVEIRVYSPG
ncbi:glyoxalase domain protein [Treponema primitia ZAS-2]|uniref:Glyoxalase domain protein n=1 Tax=Treponema primitia (strain ATCC BAA-887 / DSM 12427 / ZAS-2) TaxID=545694 RepID=F5YJA3_TREPZ|nr:VOC family protein [Treponema primitia]AEF83837.1 glyoxalase domain protein [Treponema primitia ZAS-2]